MIKKLIKTYWKKEPDLLVRILVDLSTPIDCIIKSALAPEVLYKDFIYSDTLKLAVLVAKEMDKRKGGCEIGCYETLMKVGKYYWKEIRARDKRCDYAYLNTAFFGSGLTVFEFSTIIRGGGLLKEID